ncbi:hypothetical protein pb186bvf_005930 [Paramecium bursaria]
MFIMVESRIQAMDYFTKQYLVLQIEVYFDSKEIKQITGI